MSDELEAKLRAILEDHCAVPDEVSVNKHIAQIDQAYKDAGVAPGTAAYAEASLRLVVGGLMTSREWYERLERTLDRIIATAPAPQAEILKVGRRSYLKIAKMAAGLEGGDD